MEARTSGARLDLPRARLRRLTLGVYPQLGPRELDALLRNQVPYSTTTMYAVRMSVNAESGSPQGNRLRRLVLSWS